MSALESGLWELHQIAIALPKIIRLSWRCLRFQRRRLEHFVLQTRFDQNGIDSRELIASRNANWSDYTLPLLPIDDSKLIYQVIIISVTINGYRLNT